MFEAYKIGVRIGVVDATAGGILKIASQFAKAQKEASAFLNTLRKVNEELKKTASGWAGDAAGDFNRARRAADDYAQAARRASRAASPETGMAVVAGYAGGRYAAGYLPGLAMLRLPGASGGSSPSLAMLGLPRGSYDSFPAVSMLRLPGSSGGGALPPGGSIPLLGGGGASGPIMAAAGFPMGFGSGSGGGGNRGGGGNGFSYGPLGAMAGGWFLEQEGKQALGMLGGPIEEAARYQSAVARFQLYGLGDQLNAEAIKFATSMHIVGTSMTDAVNFMAEAQGVFRESGLNGSASLAGAKLAAPMLAKIAFATSGLDEDTKAKIHTQSLAMLRFVEMRGGLSSPARFNELANEGWKAIRSSGGNVAWEQLRQFMSTGGVAAQGLSDKALFGEMEPIIGEMKGGGAGTAFMTAFSRMNGLQRLMPRIFQHEVLRLGLWDRSKLTFNSQGGIKDMNGNPLINANAFSKSPFEYYRDVILPAYKKAGITNDSDVFRENAILFGNTGGKMFSIMYRQQNQIAQSVDAQRKTLGIDASVGVAKGTFQGQMLDYQKKMQDLQIQLGKTILPMLINGLRWLNPHLQSAANWIGQHSTLTKGLVIAFAAFGGLAMLSGSILAMAGAFSLISGAVAAGGGLAAGLGGVAAGLSALGPAIAVASAAILGWKAGGYINKHFVEGTKFGDWLGSAEAHTLAFFGNKEAKDAIAMENKAKSVTHVHLHVDGREIAHAAVPHIADMASKPQTGMSGWDSSMFPSPVGINYGN